MAVARPTIWPRTERRSQMRSPLSLRRPVHPRIQPAYGRKVAHRFCPNILPYEVGTQATFGFAEWNGRSLTDNVPDVMFSLAANTPVRLGIGKESGHQKTFAGLPICTFSGLTPTEAPGRPNNSSRPTCRRSLPTQTADPGYAVPGASAYFLGGAGAWVRPAQPAPPVTATAMRSAIAASPSSVPISVPLRLKQATAIVWRT